MLEIVMRIVAFGLLAYAFYQIILTVMDIGSGR